MGVRLRTMSLRPSRMIQGFGLKCGWDALGHGDWEKSAAKQVGQTGDKTSWPKQPSGDSTDIFDIADAHLHWKRFGIRSLMRGIQCCDGGANAVTKPKVGT